MFSEFIKCPQSDEHWALWDNLNADSDGALARRFRYLQIKYCIFTVMELHCLILIERGYTNGEIAMEFNIRPQTVDNHTHDIRKKGNIQRSVRLSEAFPPTPRNMEKPLRHIVELETSLNIRTNRYVKNLEQFELSIENMARQFVERHDTVDGTKSKFIKKILGEQ